MKKIFLLYISLLGVLAAQGSNPGFKSTGLTLGARQLALANADLATGTAQNLGDSIAATAFGPTGLDLALTYLGQVGFFDGVSLSAVQRMSGGAFGATVHLVSAGLDSQLTGVQNPYGSLNATAGGSIDLKPLLRLPFGLAVGGAFTYVSETVGDTPIDTSCLQFGVGLSLLGDRLRVSARAARISLGAHATPFDLAAGATLKVPLGKGNSPFALATSVRYDLASLQYHTLSAGVEGSFRDWLFVRVGGVADLDSLGATARSGITAGLGVQVKGLWFDAAVRPFSLTGMDMLFTVQTFLPEGKAPAGGEGDMAAPILAQAREALAAGRLDEARSITIAGLERYPDHVELNQLFQFIALQAMVRERQKK